MSMTGNPPNMLEQDPEAPVEDNMHWPLILNVPGEGKLFSLYLYLSYVSYYVILTPSFLTLIYRSRVR